MDIIALKLVTGEDILGECSGVSTGPTADKQFYRLTNPVGISIVRGQNNQPNIGFSPFPLHSEDKTGKTIDISSQFVVYSYEPAEDFRENYEGIFGSGLIVPNKKLITG